MGTMESVAKTLSYWSTGNGDNTMVTLWNPADEPQSLKFVLYFAGGDGQYTVPIYLNGRETRSFNISTIINSSTPDADGNVIPPGTHEGRAEIMGANGENEHILIAMSEGVYNVQKATCGNNYCQTCQGAVNSWITASPFTVANGGNTNLTFTVQYKSGTQYNHTSVATWTSSNSSIATVNTGTVHGASPGSVSMDALDDLVADYSYICYSANPDSTCPTYTGQEATAGGNVTQCPTSVSLENTAPIQLESDFPTYKTGIGLVASMQVSGSSSASYNNSKVSESLSVNNVMQNTCSAYVSECNGSATFTVGAGGDDTPRMHMSKWQRVALSLISETHVPLQN